MASGRLVQSYLTQTYMAITRPRQPFRRGSHGFTKISAIISYPVCGVCCLPPSGPHHYDRCVTTRKIDRRCACGAELLGCCTPRPAARAYSCGQGHPLALSYNIFLPLSLPYSLPLSLPLPACTWAPLFLRQRSEIESTDKCRLTCSPRKTHQRPLTSS